MQHAGSITEMACPVRGPRAIRQALKGEQRMWLTTKNNTLARRNVNVANPRFTQTQQVGVDTRQTQRKFFGHGDLETLRMSLRGCSRPTDSPLLFLFAIKQKRLSHAREISPREKMMGPNERSTRYKIELTARTKKRFLSAHVTGRAACAVGKDGAAFMRRRKDGAASPQQALRWQ